jgi:hypothetical protein
MQSARATLDFLLVDDTAGVGVFEADKPAVDVRKGDEEDGGNGGAEGVDEVVIANKSGL